MSLNEEDDYHPELMFARVVLLCCLSTVVLVWWFL